MVVTGTVDRMRIATAVEAGAVGFVCKSQPFEKLLECVLRAVAGERVLSENDRQALLAELRGHRRNMARLNSPFERLSGRERQVLAALGDGRSVDAIAREWVVSEATVRTQVRGVLTKLDVNSQLAAVAKAWRAGWLARLT